MALITTGYEPKHTPNQVNFLEGCIPDALFNQVKEAYSEYCEQNFKAVQKQVPLGYFETRQEAMICLAEYNKNPYDLKSNKTTFEDIWTLIQPDIQKLSKSSQNLYKYAFKGCQELHEKKVSKIVAQDLQKIIDENNSSKAVQKQYMNLFKKVFSYAEMNALIEKNPVQYLKLTSEATVKEKQPFTALEIRLLWNNINYKMPRLEGKANRLADMELVDILLILLYTGMRINELLAVQCSDVDLKERVIQVHGTKTANAERVVPIHKDILPLIENRMMEGKPLFRSKTGIQLSYYTFVQDFFYHFREQFNLNHSVHDTRHTFISFAHKCKMDEVTVKKIVGHASKDIHFDTYTHMTNEQLIQEIDKLTFE